MRGIKIFENTRPRPLGIGGRSFTFDTGERPRRPIGFAWHRHEAARELRSAHSHPALARALPGCQTLNLGGLGRGTASMPGSGRCSVACSAWSMASGVVSTRLDGPGRKAVAQTAINGQALAQPLLCEGGLALDSRTCPPSLPHLRQCEHRRHDQRSPPWLVLQDRPPWPDAGAAPPPCQEWQGGGRLWQEGETATTRLHS